MGALCAPDRTVAIPDGHGRAVERLTRRNNGGGTDGKRMLAARIQQVSAPVGDVIALPKSRHLSSEYKANHTIS